MSGDAANFLRKIFSMRERPVWLENLTDECSLHKALLRYVPHYVEENEKTALNFFKNNKLSSIDGRYGDAGVEEKYMPLTPDKLIDGAIHRGLVWCLGNPQGIPEDSVEAVGLCVITRPKSGVNGRSQLSQALINAFFPVVASVYAEARIHVTFVREDTGERWPRSPGEYKPSLPMWLADRDPVSWDLVAARPDIIEELDQEQGVPNLEETFFGMRTIRWESGRASGALVGRATCDDRWRMLEAGLLLRGMGCCAARVIYTGPELPRRTAPQVELRVASRMKEIFGVVLDWNPTLSQTAC